MMQPTTLPPHPTLGEVGEHAAIAAITAFAPSERNGDDAAVLGDDAPNSRTVLTTDMMVEGRHFRLDWSTPEEIGEKAITQNFADVEAMGARPTAAVLALSLPPSTPLALVQALAHGVGKRVGQYGAELVGGDITAGDAIVVSVSAVGQLGGSLPALTLDRARPGHTLVASGNMGDSAAGLALLERCGREHVPEQLLPLVQAHCATVMPPGRGFVARSAGVSAMTDNSDGLVQDLTTLAERSGVCIDLDPDAIAPSPLLIEAGEYLGIDPWTWVLTGGEDHTLLGTTSRAAPIGFRVIGSVGKHRGASVTVGHNVPQQQQGWVSF